MTRRLLIALTISLLALPAQAEAPLGDWLCTGSNPGDQRGYKGYVSVMRSGETYTVFWRFGTSTYIGTGIDSGDAFAVSFTQPQTPTSAPSVGLAIFRKQGENWVGRWTQLGGKSIGLETWRKLSSGSGDKSGGSPQLPAPR